MIDLEKAIATGEIDWDDEDEAAFNAFLERSEIKRFQSISRLSGLEVTRSLSEEGRVWWPVYFWTSTEPVAWVHSITHERRDQEPD